MKTFKVEWTDLVCKGITIKAETKEELKAKWFKGELDLSNNETLDGYYEEGSLEITEVEQ